MLAGWEAPCGCGACLGVAVPSGDQPLPDRHVAAWGSQAPRGSPRGSQPPRGPRSRQTNSILTLMQRQEQPHALQRALKAAPKAALAGPQAPAQAPLPQPVCKQDTQNCVNQEIKSGEWGAKGARRGQVPGRWASPRRSHLYPREAGHASPLARPAAAPENAGR
jgi:hypothetical protein